MLLLLPMLLFSIKLYVSFAENSLFYRSLLQKRPIISSMLSLLPVLLTGHCVALLASVASVAPEEHHCVALLASVAQLLQHSNTGNTATLATQQHWQHSNTGNTATLARRATLCCSSCQSHPSRTHEWGHGTEESHLSLCDSHKQMCASGVTLLWRVPIDASLRGVTLTKTCVPLVWHRCVAVRCCSALLQCVVAVRCCSALLQCVAMCHKSLCDSHKEMCASTPHWVRRRDSSVEA